MYLMDTLLLQLDCLNEGLGPARFFLSCFSCSCDALSHSIQSSMIHYNPFLCQSKAMVLCARDCKGLLRYCECIESVHTELHWSFCCHDSGNVSTGATAQWIRKLICLKTEIPHISVPGGKRWQCPKAVSSETRLMFAGEKNTGFVFPMLFVFSYSWSLKA